MFFSKIRLIVVSFLLFTQLFDQILVETRSTQMDKVILISGVSSPPMVIYKPGKKKRPGKIIVING